MKKILISTDRISIEAKLLENSTAEKIWNALPIYGIVNTWGNEIYFEIPLNIKLHSEAQELVDPGTLGYWPPGKAFCIFFGATPASTDSRPRAASPVNMFGCILGDPTLLSAVQYGSDIQVEQAGIKI